VRLGEVVAALSLAADVGLGVPLETGLQLCALSLALAERMGLDETDRDRVFYLSLLRHIGCTAASDDVASVAGDEIALRRGAVGVDLAAPRELLPYLLRLVSETTPPARRPLALARLLAGKSSITAASADVCEAARTLAGRLCIGRQTLDDLGVYYERWDGKGMLGTAAGDEIPPPVQVVQVAEAANAYGPAAAPDVVRAHAGGMFAPPAADAFVRDPAAIFAALDVPSLWEIAAGRGGPIAADDDGPFELLADFADLRSAYLAGHSRGVARLAALAGERAGLPPADVVGLRRAGLVHDVGRAAVPARVWGKPGPLTRSEWEQVRLHPYHAERVLARPAAFAALGRVASFHHERCDGSGYFRGVRELPASAKLLAAADALHAMTEPRPHRPALELEQAAPELRAGVRTGAFDGEAADCVLAAAGATPRRTQVPGGLTPREVEVLRLLARGLTKRQVAKELVIAPKTADAHVQHIYAKLGVSTRAGATLFAMQRGLLDSLAD
jgi:HD-GYP domain-containing protein (c-di-GMP phosphodiesterase class II)